MMDFLSYVIAFATGAAITVAILIFIRLGAQMSLTHSLHDKLHEEIVGWRSDDSAARVDNLKLSQEARRAASRFLEENKQTNEVITTALESLVKNTYESIATAQEAMRLNEATLLQSQQHTARLDRLIEMRTPRLEEIRATTPQPTAPTSYGEIDPDAPVTWAQIKAAGERKRAREAAAAPPQPVAPPAPAPMSPEPEEAEEDEVEDFSPPPEYMNKTIEEGDAPRRFTAFDDILRRARKENPANE